MVQGVLVKIDTSGAIVAQQTLNLETEKVFLSLGKQNQQIEQMERRMSQMANTTQQVFAKTRGGVLVPEQFVTEASKAGRAVDGVGASANRAASFLQKLLGASGMGGAARGFGLVTSAGRALLGSLNPIGIAVGFVSAALLSLVVNSGRAETALDKQAKAALEAQKEYSFLAEVRERAGAAIPAELNASDLRAGKDPIQDRIEVLQRQAQDLREVRKKFQLDAKAIADTFSSQEADLQQAREGVRELLRGGQADPLTGRFPGAAPGAASATGRVPDNLLLGGEQAKKLLASLRRDDLKIALEKAQRQVAQGPLGLIPFNDEDREAIAARESLRTAGFRQTQAGEFRISAADAEKLITAELEKQRKELEEINKQLVGRNLGDLKLINVLQRQDAEEEDLGPRERAALSAQRANKAKIGREFEPSEEAVNKQTIDVARQLDAEAKAAQEAKKALDECTQSENQRNEAAKRALETYEESIHQLNVETGLLQLSAQERRTMVIALELDDKAKKAGVEVTGALALQHRDLAEQMVAAEDAAKALAEIDSELAAENEKLTESEKRRVATLGDLEDETRILLSTTQAQVRAAKEQAAVNQALRNLNLRADSKEGREIEAAVRRNELAKEYQETLKSAQETAGRIAGELGGAFVDAAFAAGGLAANLKKVIKELLILEAKKQVVALFANLGSAFVGAAFGAPATNYAPGNAATPFYTDRQAHGGIQHRAAAGLMIDKWGVVNYGDRSVGVGEAGGAKPEVILPLQRTKFGEMGVQVAGSMGGTTIINVPHIQTANEIAKARPTILQAVAQMDRMRSRYAGSVRAR